MYCTERSDARQALDSAVLLFFEALRYRPRYFFQGATAGMPNPRRLASGRTWWQDPESAEDLRSTLILVNASSLELQTTPYPHPLLAGGKHEASRTLQPRREDALPSIRLRSTWDNL